MENNFHMLAKSLSGLEEVLYQEVRELGGMDVIKLNRGVSFRGDLGFLYKANLWLRTALRIIVPIREFKARNEEEIYRNIKRIPWEEYFTVEKTILVKANVFAPHIRNSLFVAQRVKDGIADRFREKQNQRPSVNKANPDIVIDIHVARERVSVSLDSSGASLHKRGYRQHTDQAPLSEVLAAGILKLAGWDGLKHFLDPMCGSGTILIEAALMAHNIPPGVFRKEYAFKNWRNFDQSLFDLLFGKALEKEKNFHFSIRGYDKDSRVLLKARKNLKTALMSDQVQIEKADFTRLKQEQEIPKPGLLIFNPPYGEKMETDIPALYEEIGHTLKHHFAGHTAWIFTASQEGIKSVGLKASQKIPLKNAKLDCWLVRYDLYEGSRKETN